MVTGLLCGVVINADAGAATGLEVRGAGGGGAMGDVGRYAGTRARMRVGVPGVGVTETARRAPNDPRLEYRRCRWCMARISGTGLAGRGVP